MYFTNITGGEPFIRTDLKDIVRSCGRSRPHRHLHQRLLHRPHPRPVAGSSRTCIRISIEGPEQTNNEIRGLADGYNYGYTTLKKLRRWG
ncbi:MAG: hypothetical protein ACLUIR_02055 [Faecalibacterium prausnitzii]